MEGKGERGVGTIIGDSLGVTMGIHVFILLTGRKVDQDLDCSQVFRVEGVRLALPQTKMEPQEGPVFGG